VEQLEARLRAIDDETAQRLIAVYQSLVAQFSTDLRDERDELLSRGGALMLIQEFLRGT
jgi:hypothetical protein